MFKFFSQDPIPMSSLRSSTFKSTRRVGSILRLFIYEIFSNQITFFNQLLVTLVVVKLWIPPRYKRRGALGGTRKNFSKFSLSKIKNVISDRLIPKMMRKNN